MKPVAVTGLGAVSPFGAGVKAYWDGISGGVCAIRPITLIDTEGFRCRIGAEVPEGVAGLGATVARRPAGPGRRARSAGRRRRRARRARGGRADRGSGRRRNARSRGVVLAARARRPRADAARARARAFPARTPTCSAARLGLGGPRETVVTACSSGAVSLGAGGRPGGGRCRAAGDRRRSRCADADLLHGVQRAEASRSGAVPSLRSRSARHVDRRGGRVRRARGRRPRAGARGASLRRAGRLRHDE